MSTSVSSSHSEKKQKILLALSPKLFAFGGGTKPVSQLLFNKYDQDHSGQCALSLAVRRPVGQGSRTTSHLGLISASELRFLCYDMGYFLSDDQLDWARTLIDKDGSGEINYEEFSLWWQNPSRFDHILLSDKQLEKLHVIADLFRQFDRWNSGQLAKKQFGELFQEMIRRNLMDANQANQFEEIDRSHDGKINFNELIAWFYEQGVLDKLGIVASNEER